MEVTKPQRRMGYRCIYVDYVSKVSITEQHLVMHHQTSLVKWPRCTCRGFWMKVADSRWFQTAPGIMLHNRETIQKWIIVCYELTRFYWLTNALLFCKDNAGNPQACKYQYKKLIHCYSIVGELLRRQWQMSVPWHLCSRLLQSQGQTAHQGDKWLHGRRYKQN